MVRAATRENIADAAALLRAGELVAFPTETVYGLGANALDVHAVAKIFEAKSRPTFDPLIVHIADELMLLRVACDIPDLARRSMRAFWPGPLTLVLPKTHHVPDLVTAGLSTVAVRMPAHPVAHALVTLAATPIAAPSANRFGALSPTTAHHVMASLDTHVSCILDDGPTLCGIESTILAFLPKPTILRHGAIPREDLESVLDCTIDEQVVATQHPIVPGQLAQHYAPRIPLWIIEPSTVALADRSNRAQLAFMGGVDGYAATRVLSAKGDLREAATQIFAHLHELELLHVDQIDAQPVPTHGIGAAIMDRLVRAATKE